MTHFSPTASLAVNLLKKTPGNAKADDAREGRVISLGQVEACAGQEFIDGLDSTSVSIARLRARPSVSRARGYRLPTIVPPPRPIADDPAEDLVQLTDRSMQMRRRSGYQMRKKGMDALAQYPYP